MLRPIGDIVALIAKPDATKTDDDRRTLAKVAVDALGSFALDHLAIGSVGVSTRDDKPVTFRLGRLVIDGWSPAQVGTWAINDVALATTDASLRLGRFALHGPDESALFETLVPQAVDGRFDTTRMMGNLPGDASMSLTDLHLDVPSKDRPGNSPDGKRNVVDVPVASASSVTDPVTKVLMTSAYLQALYPLPPSSDNPAFRALAARGIDDLDLKADYRLALDPRAREARLERFALAADRLGRVSVGARLGNISFDTPTQENPPQDPKTAVGQVTFYRLELGFENAGVFEMMLPPLAASANTSVPLVKAGLKTGAQVLIAQALGAAPAADRLVAAIDTFVDDPKSLDITIEAPGGLSVADIAAAKDPKALLDRVGIEAVANR